MSRHAHPAITEPPPGLSAGVPFPAHPELSSTKAVKSEAILPSSSSSQMAESDVHANNNGYEQGPETAMMTNTTTGDMDAHHC